MMRTIHLHGRLKEFEILYGGPFQLQVTSAGEACRLLAAQIPGLERMLREGNFRVRAGSLKGDGRTLRDNQAKMYLGRHKTIHIMPVGKAAWGGGDKRAQGKIIIGVTLLAVAVTAGVFAAPAGATFGAAMHTAVAGGELGLGITYGSIAMAGASMALTGAAQLLAGNPMVGRYEQREAPEDRPNFLFNGAVNSVNEGAAIPWVFGKRVRVGSVVIGAGIFNEQTGPGLPEPETDGMIATVQGSATGEVNS